nr:hypothetical protein [Tanacetum cinerariifolium]
PTQDDLDELIIKYNIPCALHPQLPSKEFVMSELLDDAIGVYHHLGPLRLNKVVIFEVLCRSLQIEATVTLFRVFQTICKQVMGIHDFLCLPDQTKAKVQEEPPHDIRPTLQRLPLYCTPSAATNTAIPDPTLEDLAAGTLSAKVLAKAESFKKQKASTSSAPSSHVAKRTSASSGSASLPWSSYGPAPCFRDLSRDAIYRDFFPFSLGPYYALYLEGGVAGFCKFSREKWDAPYQPTLSFLIKKVFKDPVVCKTIVDRFPTP